MMDGFKAALMIYAGMVFAAGAAIGGLIAWLVP